MAGAGDIAWTDCGPAYGYLTAARISHRIDITWRPAIALMCFKPVATASRGIGNMDGPEEVAHATSNALSIPRQGSSGPGLVRVGFWRCIPRSSPDRPGSESRTQPDSCPLVPPPSSTFSPSHHQQDVCPRCEASAFRLPVRGR